MRPPNMSPSKSVTLYPLTENFDLHFVLEGHLRVKMSPEIESYDYIINREKTYTAELGHKAHRETLQEQAIDN